MEKGRAFPLNHCVPMHKIAQYGEQLFENAFDPVICECKR